MQIELPTMEQRLAVESIRKFLEAEVRPVIAEFRNRNLPKGRMRELLQGLAEFGLPGASIAPEHGGLGLSLVTEAMLFEELCAVSVDLALCVMINKAAATLLAELPEEQAALRERYLPELLGGRSFAAFGISEAQAGSNLAELRTQARRDGEVFVVNGSKSWVSNGNYSDFVILAVHTGGEGLSQLLVDRREHGYVTRSIAKLALNSSSAAQACFTDSRVPCGNLLGAEGAGLKRILQLFENARANGGLLAVGLMRAALQASLAYARQRTQFGKPIAAHQLVAARIAEMATQLDAARLLCFRAFSMMDAGLRCDMEAAMAKWYATEAAVRVCRDAVQLHGGNGLTKDFEVERLAREAMVLPIPDGTSEIQLLLISRALTGIGAFT